MEYRQLGNSGLRVSALTLGTMTFGGAGHWARVGDTDLADATRQIDICIDRGINFIDTANVYSSGLSEEILGEAIKHRRDQRAARHQGAHADGRRPQRRRPLPPPHHHRVREQPAAAAASTTSTSTRCTNGTAQTPLEETMEALDTLVRSGKVRYVGCSNYAGWQLMKALAVADRHGYQRFVSAADLLLAAGARRRVRAAPDRGRPGRRHPRLEPARRRPAVGQVPARRRSPEGLAPADRLERAAGPRRGAALRHRRGAGRDRRRPRRVGRAGRARVVAAPGPGSSR